jgi:O-antigen/teichoic acid export membrane protein
VMKGTLLLTGPMSVAIFVLCPYLVIFVIGPKWAPIVPLVQILVIAGMIRSFQALAGALFQACGNPGLDFKMNLPRAIVLLATIWPLTAHFGLRGAGMAVVLALLVSLPIWFYGVRKYAHLKAFEVIRLNALAMISTAVLFITLSGMDALLFARLPTWYGAVLVVLTGVTLWALVMYLIQQVSPWKLFEEVKALRVLIQHSQR